MAGRHANAMEIEAMSVTMEADPLEDDQVVKARNTVVIQAIRENPDDLQAAADQARESMMMLGIHPSQGELASPTLAPVVLNSLST